MSKLIENYWYCILYCIGTVEDLMDYFLECKVKLLYFEHLHVYDILEVSRLSQLFLLVYK